jgi:predicted protein tyrosine phosphatase
MISEIIVYPRAVIRDFLQGNRTIISPWALISICTCPEEKLIQKKDEYTLSALGCKKHITHFFGDYTNIDYSKRAAKKVGKEIFTFDEEKAKHIISFIDTLEQSSEKLTLVIHCDAGISRSGAIGIFACRYLGLDENIFREKNPYIHPNSAVYDILYKISGKKKEYEKFWESVLKKSNRIRFT